MSYATSSGTATIVGTDEHPFWSLDSGYTDKKQHRKQASSLVRPLTLWRFRPMATS
ncbi:MAG: hypothetical protein L3J82_07055 [Planctomycetes bacterium]|nr:hypothetical protein [Planctomycetota bacterium]